jgi:hypothetical protein
MTPDDAISLFAELSLGLAGFAGVGSAFAGRTREFRPLERLRLLSVVWISASVLAGSLAFVSVSFVSESASLRASAATSMLAMLVMLRVVVPPLVRAASDSNAQTEKWVPPVSVGLGIVSALLYAFITWSPTSFGLLAATFSLQLLHSLWLFVRLLTRAN